MPPSAVPNGIEVAHAVAPPRPRAEARTTKPPASRDLKEDDHIRSPPVELAATCVVPPRSDRGPGVMLSVQKIVKRVFCWIFVQTKMPRGAPGDRHAHSRRMCQPEVTRSQLRAPTRGIKTRFQSRVGVPPLKGDKSAERAAGFEPAGTSSRGLS